MHLGPYLYRQPVALAPMAGITDRPFRQLCRAWGASYAVSEMLTSDTRLWNTRKSQLRMDHRGEDGPRIVQIAGADPDMLAQAARLNVERGAEIIDINMGCPAKKVCRRAAGSALLADEALVEQLLRAVVAAVRVPVTLKYRTGPSPEQNNAVRIARLAQDAGIAALALHGRSREDAFRGQAEHLTVRAVKRAVDIPVLANGDIGCPAQARRILDESGADGLLIGRGAQGRPWLFGQIRALLDQGRLLPEPCLEEQNAVILAHVAEIHAFYGPDQGVRIARKHIGWYLESRAESGPLRRQLMRCRDAAEQLEQLQGALRALPRRAA